MIDVPVNTSHFPTDYFDARQRFRTATQQIGWSLETYPIAAPSPDPTQPDVLTIDVAISSHSTATSTLLISSGVHGAEGAFGSAVQLGMLDHWTRTNAPNLRIVLIHAINPWGYVAGRRFNEDNIDLNRNFLLDSQDYSGSPPLYPKLDPILNPKYPPRFDAFTLRSALFIARYGNMALKQAIAGGQYDFPRGLFFGGHEPAASFRIVRDNLPRWLGDSRTVAHLDFHTGLGERGTYKLLLDEPVAPEWFTRLEKAFGTGVLEEMLAEGVSYVTRGGFGLWCLEQNRHRDYLFLCPEFGTYPGLTMLKGLRTENQAYHWASPDDSARKQAKLRLAELFVPADTTWRTTVLRDAQNIVQQAVRYLLER